MSNLTIEGDFSDISDRQLKYIKSVIEERGYKDNKVTFQPVGKAGDNYVAFVKRIIIEDTNGGTIKMIAKVAPTHEQQRQMGNTELFFRNEHIMYTKVLPRYSQLEKAADVPPESKLRYATCYGSFSEVPNEVILLEDLNESNFIMLDKFKSLKPDCVKSVLRNFALLHALGYALKDKEPEIYEEYKNSIYDMWSNLEGQEGAISYFEQVKNSASKIVDSDFHKNAITGNSTGSVKHITELAKSDRDSKYSIIAQGDAWTNNIMFKYDGEGTLLESIMIDYQLSKPANPVTDLFYMIFNCTDYETRKEKFYDWIDYYHKELEKALLNHGLEASLVYPKDQLYTDLKRYGKMCFGISLIVIGVLSMKTEEASEMRSAIQSADSDVMAKNADMCDKHPETIALYKKRIEGLIDSYYEFELL